MMQPFEVALDECQAMLVFRALGDVVRQILERLLLLLDLVLEELKLYGVWIGGCGKPKNTAVVHSPKPHLGA